MGHYNKLVKEIELLYKDRSEVKSLKDISKTLDIVQTKHHEQFEELKKRLHDSEEDKVKMKQRLEAAVEKEKVFAVSKFSKDILEIFDNLERAMGHANPSDKDSTLYKGLELTHNQGLQILKRYFVYQMEDPIDKKFDPNFHEVVFESPNKEKASGTVIAVLSKGYLIHDRLLRPSVVGVTRKD